MVGSLALERNVSISYETIKTFLRYASPAHLSHFVTSMLYGNGSTPHHDSVQTTHANMQTSHTSVESNHELQAILKDPQWEIVRTTNQREALVVSSLSKLGYRSVSGLYNPKGRHAIFGSQGLLVSLDVMKQTYIPKNGSVPHDMMQVLDKACFKPIL